MLFVYRLDERYYYHPWVPRQVQGYFPGIEYLGQVKALSQLKQFVGEQPCDLLVITETSPCHVRQEEKERVRREKIRQAKLGDKNPNTHGLSASHREKIRQTMQGYNRGSDNINFGKPRGRDIRAKISQTKRRNAQQVKYRWALSPEGTEHLLSGELPPGYVWGRKRFVIKLSPRPVKVPTPVYEFP